MQSRQDVDVLVHRFDHSADERHFCERRLAGPVDDRNQFADLLRVAAPRTARIVDGLLIEKDPGGAENGAVHFTRHDENGIALGAEVYHDPGARMMVVRIVHMV